MSAVSHPCPFPDSTIKLIGQYLPMPQYWNVIDPFAGIGRIHALPNETYGIELEPEWANQHPDTEVGNALHLPWQNGTFEAAATSPCFGNRMADHHNAKDSSARNTYRHKLGHDLSPNSSAVMQWGSEYRKFHRLAWRELTRVIAPGGRFILNIKNHIRNGKEQRVSEWHLTTLTRMGWSLVALELIHAPGNRYGANHDLRVDYEYLMVFDAVWTTIPEK